MAAASSLSGSFTGAGASRWHSERKPFKFAYRGCGQAIRILFLVSGHVPEILSRVGRGRA